MKLPRRRFTVRRLMIVVAIVGLDVGVGIEVERWWARFAVAASSHAYFVSAMEQGGQEGGRSYAWHLRMQEKYEFAAWCHWLPFMSDPPKPTEQCASSSPAPARRIARP